MPPEPGIVCWRHTPRDPDLGAGDLALRPLRSIFFTCFPCGVGPRHAPEVGLEVAALRGDEVQPTCSGWGPFAVHPRVGSGRLGGGPGRGEA